MARSGNPEADDYWIQELESLGIEPKRMSELNDRKELESLVDNIKQKLYDDYKAAYSR